jgi:cytochrome c-type biogenesis protein CcmH
MSRWRALVPLLAPVLLAAAPAPGPAPDLAAVQLADPRQEERARTLMETLRCLVCQGQSIADSDADMAGDMRALVRRRIAAGEAPDAIRRDLVRRYGDYVTYDPPLGWLTAPLWLAPLLLLGLGVLIARRSFSRSPAASTPPDGKAG